MNDQSGNTTAYPTLIEEMRELGAKMGEKVRQSKLPIRTIADAYDIDHSFPARRYPLSGQDSR